MTTVSSYFLKIAYSCVHEGSFFFFHKRALPCKNQFSERAVNFGSVSSTCSPLTHTSCKVTPA